MVIEPREPSEKFVRALSFGSVAENYERHRLGYPNELVDAVRRYVERPVCTALEVGAGTGKATQLFAARGVEVTALEPDAEMVKVLERVTHGLPVRPVVATFEQFRTESHFDLVYAAAAWHWTSPETRWTHAVELLAPGGVFALFGSQAELKDPDLCAAVEEIEKRVLADDESVDVHPWSIEEMATVSAYLKLAPERRAETLRQVRAALPDQVDIDTTVQLCLARRVDRSVR